MLWLLSFATRDEETKALCDLFELLLQQQRSPGGGNSPQLALGGTLFLTLWRRAVQGGRSLVIPEENDFSVLHERWKGIGCDPTAELRSTLKTVADANRDTLPGLDRCIDAILPPDANTVIGESTASRTLDLLEKLQTAWPGSINYADFLHRVTRAHRELAPYGVTPPELGRLLVDLLKPDPGKFGLNPWCGFGSMLFALAKGFPKGVLHGTDTDPLSVLIGRLLLLLDNPRTKAAIGPQQAVEPSRKTELDFLVANIASRPAAPRAAALELYGHITQSNNPVPRALLVLPRGVLFRGGKEAEFRRRILRDGRLQAVVVLPKGTLYDTSAPPVLLMLGARPAAGRILFMDLSPATSRGRFPRPLKDTGRRIQEALSSTADRGDGWRRIPFDDERLKAKPPNLDPARYLAADAAGASAPTDTADAAWESYRKTAGRLAKLREKTEKALESLRHDFR